MKRLMILAMLFAFLGVQQASAQKWAKKLGKVANAVLSDSKKAPSTASNVVSSNPAVTFNFR